MKILLCTNAFENITNGPAKFANLVLQINDRYPEHQIRILTEDISEEKAAAHPYVYKIRLNYPKFLRIFGQILRMFIYYNRVRKIEKEFDYDVLVYINSFNGLWASMLSPKPTIGMINDDNNLNASLTTIGKSQRWLKKFFFRFLENASTRFHKLIITNSDYLTNQLLTGYSINPNKVYRLYKSVDLDNICYQPNRLFQTPFRILFVKADYMRGGLPILAEALKKLASYTFVLTIVGPNIHFSNHITTLFNDITNVKIQFLGEQPQTVVYDLLSTHDIFCVPSLQEALGVANIEALAFGIPVVTSTSGGIPEVVDNGHNGWLSEPGNPVALAAALQECLCNPKERLKKSENGYKFIQKFSAPYMFKEFLCILEECK